MRQFGHLTSGCFRVIVANNKIKISLKERRMQAPRKAKTVLRAFEVLEEVSRFDEGISNAALAARLNFHPSTTYRLLNTLVSKGYVGKDNGLYRIGYKVLELQCLTELNAKLRSRARPLLTDLENRIGFTTNLAIRDGLKAVLIEIIKGSKNLVVNNNLGKPVPLHATSVGKCLLAFLPEGEQEALVKQLQLEAYTPKTITNSSELLQELEITRKRGYGIDNEEFVTGIRCIGAPILNEEREVVAAISIAGLASQIQNETIDNFAKDVIRTSENVSSRLFALEGVWSGRYGV